MTHPERLSRRALNRALLERQLLLRRWKRGALDTIEHLVGLQAQIPNSPYIALWSRIEGFHIDDLTTLVTRRKVVRLALMRSTIHMVSARDCLQLRPLVQTVLDRGLTGSFGRSLKGIDLEALAAAGRGLVDAQPLTLRDLGVSLSRRWADRDPEALAQGIRARVPLVQVPPRGVWGDSGAAACTSAEKWLGRSLASSPSLEKAILRYLAAFGPASVRDIQAWSGLTKLREPVERLRKRLRTFVDPNGVEVFDLPDAPRPRENVDAAPRFLPEFDNVWLGHKDRSRVLSETQAPRMLGSGGLLMGSLLVDGFVAGRWRITVTSNQAILAIDPFEKLASRDRIALEEEGDRLLAFATDTAVKRDIRFGASARR